MTIWKYQIPIIARFSLPLPQGAKALSFQVQPGQGPALWVQADSDLPLSARCFAIVGTGHPIPEHIVGYVGTVQIPPFVWHLYEIESEPDATAVPSPDKVSTSASEMSAEEILEREG